MFTLHSLFYQRVFYSYCYFILPRAVRPQPCELPHDDRGALLRPRPLRESACMYIYIYIYIERERDIIISSSSSSYMPIYIYIYTYHILMICFIDIIIRATTYGQFSN